MKKNARVPKTRVAGGVLSVFLVLPLWSEEGAFLLHGKEFRVMRCDPSQVRMLWKGANGKPISRFKEARQQLLTAGAAKVTMLMNGGIFEPGLTPSGFYLAEGQVERPLNLKAGKGNFFLKPNGVFFVRKTEGELSAGVLRSEELAKWTPEEQASLWYAVQSGPLLLREGKTHPAFQKGSKNVLRRNGVGVDEAGRVVFVITAERSPVNLWTFADCFRQLGCQDALFLDGVISQMSNNPGGDVKGLGFATILGVVE